MLKIKVFNKFFFENKVINGQNIDFPFRTFLTVIICFAVIFGLQSYLTSSYNNHCNPFKYDLRCALFSLLSLLKTKSTPQWEPQRMSYLKGLQRLDRSLWCSDIGHMIFLKFGWRGYFHPRYHQDKQTS